MKTVKLCYMKTFSNDFGYRSEPSIKIIFDTSIEALFC